MIARCAVGLSFATLLLLLPVAAVGQGNPWHVPPAASAHGGGGWGAGAPPQGTQNWGGQGWGGQGWNGQGRGLQGWNASSWREPSYAPAPSAPLPATATCGGESRWAAVETPVTAGQRRMSDASGLYAAGALTTSALPIGGDRGWTGERRGAAPAPAYAPPQVILGDFPPLDEDATRSSATERRSERGGYAAESHAAALPDRRGTPPAARGWGGEMRPYASGGYPALPPGPSTLGGAWGGTPGSYGYGGYAPYGYPFASGVPAPYGWF